ncbi:MAG: 3-hydroxybutyryl-CoA dehydrogenase [Frankiales bacterium]|nr:3-hydroxybutyryl-CoA dehydrogenase [Frankiales bacterium]
MQSVGVIGAGTMGVGIAYVYAAAGCRTLVAEPDAGRAQALLETLRTQAERGVARGKLTAEQAAELPRRLEVVGSPAELPTGLDLVVESVPERLELKHEVLAAAAAREPALLATNTSALSVDALAERLPRPDAFLGMHFFNPVWSLGMVELIRGGQTSDETVATAQSLVELIGKQSIVVRDVPGFATSRLDLVAALEAMRMFETQVASAEDIDKAMVLAYRHPMGPLRLSDVVGLDVRLDISRNLHAVYGERFAPPQVLVDLVEQGHLGQKTGQGFYAWP